MQERRQHYRVQAEFAKEVNIQLSFGSTKLNTKAKDLSAGGVSILLPLEIGKPLQMGGSVDLSFDAPWSKVLRLTGKVLRKTIYEETLLEVGIAFTEWEHKRDSLGHRLRRIFNERRVHRVSTPPIAPPRGLVSLGTGETERLSVAEIGVFGARLASKPDREVQVGQTGSITLDFGRGALAFPCKVKHIQPEDEERPLTFGIHFYTLEKMDKNFERTMIDYVFGLQRTDLQGPK